MKSPKFKVGDEVVIDGTIFVRKITEITKTNYKLIVKSLQKDELNWFDDGYYNIEEMDKKYRRLTKLERALK